ncbi:MAG: FAD:protein FMN transferase, partial [Myxococcota bacterium]
MAGLRAALGLTLAAAVAAEPRLVERSRPAMGSSLSIAVWADDEPRAAAAIERAFVEFDRLEALMTVWRETSDIARLNAAAGRRPVLVAPEVRQALRAARRVSEWTGGKFDVTFGALAGLWKFDHDQDDRIPDPAEVRRRLPLVDYRDLVVDERVGTAFLRRKGMRAHLGGIGKGFAVDRVVAILREAGLRDFFVQAGGDLYVSGRRGDRAWRVGIRDPRGPEDRYFATLDLADSAFSTSGDYERFFFDRGRRYHHILDPTTGEPARGCRGVTILAPDATTADGLSTGVFLLGPKDGMALVERLPGVAAVIVDDRNRVIVSSGLRDRLGQVQRWPPAAGGRCG